MSITISVLTHESILRRGYSDLYPFRKWKKKLAAKGYIFNYYRNHTNNKILSGDILFLHHRYYEQIIKGNYSPSGFESNNLSFIKEYLHEVKQKGIPIILYEVGDSAGTRQSEMLPYVDICLKKQMFKDRTRYLKKEGEHQVQIWLPDSVKELEKFKKVPPVSKSDIQKIQLGWNIGLNDYRSFPQNFKKFFPLNTFVIPNNIYSNIKYTQPDRNRVILFSYRGKLKTANERYSYNRNKLIEQLNQNATKLADNHYIGGKVPFNEYMKELHNSKIGLSPFGWGELCYRDFEIMIAGALLIKPSVAHLETYPNYFIENETYIPTRWDHKDLAQIITDVDKNYSDYLHIAKKAQETFKYFNNSAREFVGYFHSIINKI